MILRMHKTATHFLSSMHFFAVG